MNRQQAREKALQTLFRLDFNQEEIDELINQLSSKEKESFYGQLIFGVTQHIKEIDQLIMMKLENWSIERIAIVEKTILRIAIYEMKYRQDIPPHVSINEAVNLAKKFADQQAGQFINGILVKYI